MPRFHEFETNNGKLTLDLDSIAGWLPLGPCTDVYGPGWTHRVYMPSTDVARLVNPPAAPDQYEEIIGRMKQQQQPAGLEDRPMTSEPEAQVAGEAAIATDMAAELAKTDEASMTQRLYARADELERLNEFVAADSRINASAALAIANYVIRRGRAFSRGEV